MAALVACPARRLCPAYLPASKPAPFSQLLHHAPPRQCRTTGPLCTCPCRLIDRNNGPAMMAARLDPAQVAHGQGTSLGIRAVRYADLAAHAPPGSVLLRRNVTVSPSLPKKRSPSTSSPISSDRRNAARESEAGLAPGRACPIMPAIRRVNHRADIVRLVQPPFVPVRSRGCGECPSWCWRRSACGVGRFQPHGLYALRQLRSISAECYRPSAVPAHSSDCRPQPFQDSRARELMPGDSHHAQKCFQSLV